MQAAGDLLEVGYLTSEQVGWIRESVDDLVVQVRRQSVPLTDAFNMSDKFLNSALGRYDGLRLRCVNSQVLQSLLFPSLLAVFQG